VIFAAAFTLAFILLYVGQQENSKAIRELNSSVFQTSNHNSRILNQVSRNLTLLMEFVAFTPNKTGPRRPGRDFDELRDPGTRLPNGRELPALFNFTEQGLCSFGYF
jgi:hypothetical protein